MEPNTEQPRSSPNGFHRYNDMLSHELHAYFQQNIGEFVRYQLYAQTEEASTTDPTELPLNQIIAKLEENKHKKPKTLLDLGCGILPKIRDHFEGSTRYTVRSFDHLSIVPGVEVCDIAHLPVEEESVEYVVLSRAMCGSNCKEYLQEAYRVLDPLGRMYVGELTETWTSEGGRPAAVLMELLGECGFAIVDQSIQKFSIFTCVKK